MLKRIIVIVLLLISVFPLAFSDYESESLILETVVPENYGIHTPDDAVELGQFLFQFETEPGTSELLTDSRIVIDNIEQKYFEELTLLYYGNLSEEYNVEISIDTGSGFISSNHDNGVIPVSVSFSEADDKGEGITIIKDEEYSKANIIVPPTGPRRGEETLTITLSWQDVRDVIPGRYEMELYIGLLSRN